MVSSFGRIINFYSISILGLDISCGGYMTEDFLEFPSGTRYYPTNIICTWIIRRDHAYRIFFERFSIERHAEGLDDYLQINGGEKICGRVSLKDIYMNGSTETNITFRSDGFGSSTGFRIGVFRVRNGMCDVCLPLIS